MTCQHAICCATKSGRVWIYGALYFCSCLIEFHCCSNLASSKSSEVPVAPQSCGSPRAQRRAMAGLAWKPKHLWRSTEKSLSEVSAQAFDKWGKLVQGSILHLLCKFSPMPWSMSSHAKLCLRGKLGPKARFSSADESPQHHLVLLDQQKEKTNRVSTLPGKAWGSRGPWCLLLQNCSCWCLSYFSSFLYFARSFRLSCLTELITVYSLVSPSVLHTGASIWRNRTQGTEQTQLRGSTWNVAKTLQLGCWP